MVPCILLLSWHYLATTVTMETLFLFLGLVILWGIYIIPKFQNMFITKGTFWDLVFGDICQQLLPWEHYSCCFFFIYNLVDF